MLIDRRIATLLPLSLLLVAAQTETCTFDGSGTGTRQINCTGTDCPAPTSSGGGTDPDPTGGGTSSDGSDEAPSVGPSELTCGTSVHITSRPVNLARGGHFTFSATVSFAEGSTCKDKSVVWGVKEGAAGGAITQGLGGSAGTSDGEYIAPAKAGIYHVTAMSETDHTMVASVRVVVKQVWVEIDPPAAVVQPNGSLQLNARVTGAQNANVVWSMPDATPATDGVVRATGEYVAGTNEGTYIVRATSVEDPEVSAYAKIRVSGNGPISLRTCPSRAVLNPGDRLKLTGFVTNEVDGDLGVEWSIKERTADTGGAILDGATFIAGLVPATVTVRARAHADPSKVVEIPIEVRSPNSLTQGYVRYNGNRQGRIFVRAETQEGAVTAIDSLSDLYRLHNAIPSDSSSTTLRAWIDPSGLGAFLPLSQAYGTAVVGSSMTNITIKDNNHEFDADLAINLETQTMTAPYVTGGPEDFLVSFDPLLASDGVELADDYAIFVRPHTTPPSGTPTSTTRVVAAGTRRATVVHLEAGSWDVGISARRGVGTTNMKTTPVTWANDVVPTPPTGGVDVSGPVVIEDDPHVVGDLYVALSSSSLAFISKVSVGAEPSVAFHHVPTGDYETFVLHTSDADSSGASFIPLEGRSVSASSSSFAFRVAQDGRWALTTSYVDKPVSSPAQYGMRINAGSGLRHLVNASLSGADLALGAILSPRDLASRQHGRGGPAFNAFQALEHEPDSNGNIYVNFRDAAGVTCTTAIPFETVLLPPESMSLEGNRPFSEPKFTWSRPASMLGSEGLQVELTLVKDGTFYQDYEADFAVPNFQLPTGQSLPPGHFTWFVAWQDQDGNYARAEGPAFDVPPPVTAGSFVQAPNTRSAVPKFTWAVATPPPASYEWVVQIMDGSTAIRTQTLLSTAREYQVSDPLPVGAYTANLSMKDSANRYSAPVTLSLRTFPSPVIPSTGAITSSDGSQDNMVFHWTYPADQVGFVDFSVAYRLLGATTPYQVVAASKVSGSAQSFEMDASALGAGTYTWYVSAGASPSLSEDSGNSQFIRVAVPGGLDTVAGESSDGNFMWDITSSTQPYTIEVTTNVGAPVAGVDPFTVEPPAHVPFVIPPAVLLSPGSYKFAVRSEGPIGYTAYSPLSPFVVHQAPTDLTIDSQSTTAVSFSWTGPTSETADSYILTIDGVSSTTGHFEFELDSPGSGLPPPLTYTWTPPEGSSTLPTGTFSARVRATYADGKWATGADSISVSN